jgi:hypothetical protein
MMKEPKDVVVKSKAWIYGKRDYPSRIVLLRRYNLDGTVREYTTHLQVENTDKKRMEYYHGHYFTKLKDAELDFKSRRA